MLPQRVILCNNLLQIIFNCNKLHHSNQNVLVAATQEKTMNALIEYIKKLFAHVPLAKTDEHCPYCHGIGYDSSGWTCTCLREKK
jgi:hypothetical protein